jgi:hypothetical protein
MSIERSSELKLVDGTRLDEDLRAALRPGELVEDRQGHARRLPRFFFEVPSWQAARELRLTPNFALWEFLNVDVRESETVRTFPRYIPCAVTLLAAHLEVLRKEVGTVVHIAANGGYRTPAHALDAHASTHWWATAVNIYRIGDQMIDDREQIERFGDLARSLLPGVWTRPYGNDVEQSDDHLHLDLGFVTVVPHGAPGERASEGSSGATEGGKENDS